MVHRPAVPLYAARCYMRALCGVPYIRAFCAPLFYFLFSCVIRLQYVAEYVLMLEVASATLESEF